jgi:hypothetical protein
MSTTTNAFTYTRVHTAIHLTDVIMGTISDILADLGVDTSRLARDWSITENAIVAWIAEGSLDRVVLECRRPGGVVDPIIEFPVQYQVSGSGDAEFVASRARLARFRAKLDTVPVGTNYQLFCTFAGIRTPQPGWGQGTRASTAGLRSTSFGTLGRGPHAAASLHYLHS